MTSPPSVHSRRDLLRAGLGVAAGAALAPALEAAQAQPAKPGTLLILGGTGFIGPHLTEAAQHLGWQVTHFNRGRRTPGGVSGVETLIGDRNGQLEALRGRRWDVVIDDTGYVPSYVRQSAQLLAPNVGYHLFISSISAYASFEHPNDERSATGVLSDPDATDISEGRYGPMKALCEQYTRDTFQNRACIVRPGYIVGPLDPTDRFTYWPVRAARGGEMLVPGTPRDPVQIIDVRDLAAFLMHLAAERTPGTFNAVTPPGALTTGQLIEACREAAPAAGTTFTWVPERFLQAHWKPEDVDLPPWAPTHGDTAGLALTADRRAHQAGLRTRPLKETVRDTLAWFRSLPPERQSTLKAGLDAAREADTLRLWHAAGAKS